MITSFFRKVKNSNVLNEGWVEETISDAVGGSIHMNSPFVKRKLSGNIRYPEVGEREVT